MNIRQHRNLCVVVGICVTVSACAANPKKTIFNPDNPTMESLLGANSARNARITTEKVSQADAIAHNGSSYPNQNVFKELDNPTLFLYVEPHVTKSGTYIPGLTIPLKLYEQVEFALPGEL